MLSNLQEHKGTCIRKDRGKISSLVYAVHEIFNPLMLSGNFMYHQV